MWENILNNWRTSGLGIITAIAGLVAVFFPGEAEFINKIAAGIAILSGAVFALITKDSSVTGTALNPRSEIAGIPDPPPSPAAAVEAKKILETK